jgi:hypothetical protein
MVMRDEDVPQRGQRHSRECKLPRHAVAAINHIRDGVADDHLCRCGIRRARPRASSRAKENQPGSCALRGAGSRARSDNRKCSGQKRPTTDRATT